jgi:hypothetical protein
MKLIDIFESAEMITPSVKYKQNGDKSWNVVVEYTPERRYVHTNAKREALEKIVKDRYRPRPA